jgi:hypothetical protein
MILIGAAVTVNTTTAWDYKHKCSIVKCRFVFVARFYAGKGRGMASCEDAHNDGHYIDTSWGSRHYQLSIGEHGAFFRTPSSSLAHIRLTKDHVVAKRRVHSSVARTGWMW